MLFFTYNHEALWVVVRFDVGLPKAEENFKGKPCVRALDEACDRAKHLSPSLVKRHRKASFAQILPKVVS